MIPKPYLIGGAVILALVVAGAIYLKGQHAGEANVRTDIQRETIHQIESSRISKEKTDEAVRSTPYDRRVDELR